MTGDSGAIRGEFFEKCFRITSSTYGFRSDFAFYSLSLNIIAARAEI
jgi:hypothetical protein